MNERDNKLIVVTGGAGFIGSHLCERLVKDGHKVISLDNYFTGSEENHIDGVEYRKGHTKDIDTHITETPDIVYHLGEYSRVAQSMEEPLVVWDLNISGTQNVVEFCRNKDCKLVYAGSSTKLSDTREDGITGRDLSPYTWAKAANTDLVSNYGHWYGLKYAIVYFSNVYGPREQSGKYGTVIEIWKQKVLNNEPLIVSLPGTQTRHYTHVYDTVDALVRVGESGEGDGYGIGAEKSYSTMELAEMYEHDIQTRPARKTSRPSSKIDVSKVKALGWEEKHKLEDYIEEIKKEING